MCGEILHPLISTSHRLIKTIPAQGVGGASVLFAQFKCFITNFRSFPEFGGAGHSSLINNEHSSSLMYMGLDEPQRDPVGGVELSVCFLSREGHAGLEITKI